MTTAVMWRSWFRAIVTQWSAKIERGVNWSEPSPHPTTQPSRLSTVGTLQSLLQVSCGYLNKLINSNISQWFVVWKWFKTHVALGHTYRQWVYCKQRHQQTTAMNGWPSLVTVRSGGRYNCDPGPGSSKLYQANPGLVRFFISIYGPATAWV